jgi:hypothetical protein
VRLYQFIGGVTVHHNPMPNLDEVPWSIPPNDETVADGRVTLGNVGNLDANGKVLVQLEDNTRVLVTQQIKGADDYSSPPPTPVEYPLAITANGFALSNDVVVPDANFCVGQYIKFDVTGFPDGFLDHIMGYNAYHHDDFAQWTLPGTFVNTNSDPNCGLFYDINTSLLARSVSTNKTISTYCWYVMDTNQATVSVTLHFRYRKGGPVEERTITGKINVHRPMTAKGQPYQPDGTPTVQICGGSLSLGVSGVTNDMNFKHTITTDVFCAGQAGYVQLITSGNYTSSGTGLAQPPIPNTELDARYGKFPRGTPDVPANATTGVWFYDAPSDGLHQGNAKEELEFSTYLMFRPNGGIWVPLRLIQWGVQDEAANYALVNGAQYVTGPSDNECFVDVFNWQNVGSDVF